MNNIQKRFLLFIFGCIFVRSLFVVIAAKVKEQYLPYLGILALLPVIGWLYILCVNPRDTGREVFGAKIWWNDMRYIHSINYALFAYFAINRNPNAYKFLLFDVIIGLSAFLCHHYKEDNFKKLVE